VGLYKQGDPDTAYRWWRWTNGATTGNQTATLSLQPGTYEFRYFIDGGYTRKAVSNVVTIGADSPTVTLTPSPTTLMVGENLYYGYWVYQSDSVTPVIFLVIGRTVALIVASAMSYRRLREWSAPDTADEAA